MLKMVIPWLPPSSTHAYFHRPGGGRALSQQGKEFKNSTQAYLAQNYGRDLKGVVPNQPYLVYIRFSLPQLQNATWSGGKKGASTRYKRVDVSNRVKLLEDVLTTVTGVDDANTMVLITQKREGPKEETMVIICDLKEGEALGLAELQRR